MKKILLFAVLLVSSNLFADIIAEQLGVETSIDYSNTENIPDTVTYNFEFEVTAVGDDVYIPINTRYILWNTDPDSNTTKVDEVCSLFSRAEQVSDYYLVSDGDSESFSFILFLTPRNNGFVQASMAEFQWSDDELGPEYTHEFVPQMYGHGVYLNTHAVPEPGTISQFTMGLLVILYQRKKCKR
jgi:hypothetical protein